MFVLEFGMHRLIILLLLNGLIIGLSPAQSLKDSILPSGQKGSFQIQVIPCDCDSTVNDSISISLNQCFDSNMIFVLHPSILDFADSVALALGVPPKLIYEIGMNESRWPNVYDLDYLIKDGDLQVIDRTFNHFYNEMHLTGGKTRKNYLLVGIYYLKVNYDLYHNWRKARYAYGRGRWKSESQWTRLERHFMNKIDWSNYD